MNVFPSIAHGPHHMRHHHRPAQMSRVQIAIHADSESIRVLEAHQRGDAELHAAYIRIQDDRVPLLAGDSA